MPQGATRKRNRVLVVDDEQSVLDGLRRMLHRERQRWDFTFLSSPVEAAQLMERERFDVIITDMRMPDMSGVELLEKAREHCPSCVRIILSGHGELADIMKSVGPSHQFLSKPCDGEKILAAIERACRMRSTLSDSRLLGILGQIETLPSLPQVYTELLEALRNETPLREVGEIIARDIGMTVKMLQLVNSSYFGLPQEITDPVRAVLVLGADTITGLVLGTKLFEELPQIALSRCTGGQLLRHSSLVAGIAARLCTIESVSVVVRSQATTAGFLHDLGLFTLAAYAPALLEAAFDYREKHDVPIHAAETATIGATHGQVGGYLTGLWSFPDPIVEAVMYHDCPSESANPDLAPLTFVHVAECLAGGLETGGYCGDLLDHAYIDRLGIAERLPVWQAETRDLIEA